MAEYSCPLAADLDGQQWQTCHSHSLLCIGIDKWRLAPLPASSFYPPDLIPRGNWRMQVSVPALATFSTVSVCHVPASPQNWTIYSVVIQYKVSSVPRLSFFYNFHDGLHEIDSLYMLLQKVLIPRYRVPPKRISNNKSFQWILAFWQ